MRKLLVVFAAAVLVLLSLSFWGCSSDDDDVTGLIVEPCSVELTTPNTGERFLPGAPDSQTVKIRWDKTGGSDMVNIDLVKGGTDAVRLVTGVANNGYYSWRANNNGFEDGIDFSVRVTVDGDDECSADSEVFVLRNTIGCIINFTNAFPDSVHVDDVLPLSWEGVNLPGMVDIVLDIRGEEPNVIATGLMPNDTYDWTVTTFGLGSADRYTLRIKDTIIPNYCYDESDDVEIEEN